MLQVLARRIEYELHGVENFQLAKINAIRSVMQKWGKVMRDEMRSEAPYDTGVLKSEIRYTTEIKQKDGLINFIRVRVGVLGTSDVSRNYLKFLTEGTFPHFIPVVNKRGVSTGIAQWAISHNLINVKDGKYYWAKGKNRGKRFTGYRGKTRIDNFMERVKKAYQKKMMQEIQVLMRS